MTPHKITLSTVFAGQKVGVKQVRDKIWLVSFMDYDLGFFDEETTRLEPIANPFEARVLPMCPQRLCVTPFCQSPTRCATSADQLSASASARITCPPLLPRYLLDCARTSSERGKKILPGILPKSVLERA
jgi:hypothetical protein